MWAADEYDKLPRYDGETYEQSPLSFGCHQGDSQVCSGWLAHGGDPYELLAVRIGIVNGTLDPSCAEYSTDVALFASGAEAAEHGKRDLLNPSGRAAATIDKVTRVRELNGDPVTQMDPTGGRKEQGA